MLVSLVSAESAPSDIPYVSYAPGVADAFAFTCIPADDKVSLLLMLSMPLLSSRLLLVSMLLKESLLFADILLFLNNASIPVHLNF